MAPIPMSSDRVSMTVPAGNGWPGRALNVGSQEVRSLRRSYYPVV